MKPILSFLLLLITFHISIAQTTAIPDANFEQALINMGYDNTIDGQVLTENIDTITFLYVNGSSISDLTGIEDFNALTTLYCGVNQLTSLDFTQNLVLEKLRCDNNLLTSLNVTQNLSLTSLECNYNLITNLNVTQNVALTRLDFWGNSISSIDVTQNIALTYLSCISNQLTGLDVTQNIALTTLYCNNNQITSLDVTSNSYLSMLWVSNNQLTSLNLTQNDSLERLWCDYNQLTSLDLSQNTILFDLKTYNNQLSCLNVKNGNNTMVNNSDFQANNNPNLTCIEVDNVAYSTTNWTNIDTQTSFSTNCPNPCAVGIEENNLSYISLYPNPTSRKITIDLGKVLTTVNVTLTNNLGQIILTQMTESTDRITLDIDAPAGIYFLSIESSNGERKTIKVLKE